ncbi:MAG: sulfatase-like hydrolase/transferase [Clostridium sp.]|nr:sulfatase-like hydrolase/transferase [Clostridium sp.]MEE0127567.1 LTA synthase family protein [Clostridia bacterium]
MRQKIKENLNKIVNSNFFIIILMIVVFLKTILFYKSTICINEKIYINTIQMSIMYILSLFGMLYLLPKKGRNIAGIIMNILISILLFADNIYYSYSSNVLSVLQISNLQYGEEIMSTLPLLLKLPQILYFIDILTLIILIATSIIKIEKGKKSKTKFIVCRTIIGIICMIFFIILSINANSKVLEDPYNRDTQIKKGTIYGYHISDILNAMLGSKQAKYDNKNDMMKEYNVLKDEYNEKYGESYIDIKTTMEGKNVIILQLESIQEFVLNKTINGREITPNLNKFINENIRLSNMFMQSYSTTADSEFSTVTSLYPVENGMAYSRYYKNNYDDIFKMFHNKDYTTSYMHGNYGNFWNRTNVYNNMKVDYIELKDKFLDISENIMGYLSDELLYKQAVQKLKEYDNPFISYVVAASSHTGFTLDGLQDKSKVNINVGKYKDTFFGNYLESVNYADYAFGIFIQELKNASLYDNSVIILYGDHNGLDMYNNEMIEFLKELDSNLTDTDIKLNYIRVLAGMRIPGINNLRIDKPVSKLDIKPTLAYLCNTEEGVSLGTNMLAKKDFICLNNERIVTDKFYYDELWYDIETGEIVEENDELKKYRDFMQKELEISKSIVLENLLK